jgi:hypothetical protein
LGKTPDGYAANFSLVFILHLVFYVARECQHTKNFAPLLVT